MNNMQMENQILQVPIEDIIPNRFQPRLSFDDASLADLAASIKEHGIIQPLVLRRKNDKYEIIAGERRYKASKLAGLTSVPAVISNLDDNASAEVAIVENIQRKDLTSIEEARSYQALLDKGYMTQDELARKMGLSQSAISNKLRLLTLDESVQEAILAEKISERHARTLLKVPSHEKQKELLKKVVNERLTVKQLEDEIKKINIDTAPNNTEVNVEPKAPEAPQEVVSPITNVENTYMNVSDLPDISLENIQEDTEPITETKFFSEPEAMPNKFFNFLEDTAVNMNTEESIPSFKAQEAEVKPSVQELLNQTDNIEMLDDFMTPPNKAMNNQYINEVIKKVRNLNLDTNKVDIEEIDLPNEYHINIVIKKDDQV